MTDLLLAVDNTRSALISPCGTYRYTLGRVLGHGRRSVVWAMLNPSTADALKDDPTIRRVVDFSRRWGFDQVTVVNLYALRSSQPEALWCHQDPVGTENDRHIRRALLDAETVVCAWGAHAKADRVRAVLDLIRDAGLRPHCLGLTKHGQPRHPLYIRAAEPLTVWDGGAPANHGATA
ncbi:DUF1643 domain-containing protein [Rhodovarius crocodyli]|uniref:DUF1643 domain-containing protein n=1 Tax=Rhodovarius crocodyli TaxID=1979269 RepID=A0A437MEV8_9PROT|nr:DUF1643 domain-containing protein [Rhodovarius crocodyli]RVT96200.1 DUF1643 domain-containing protein [Rhodovarius crocodyli]